MKRKRNDIEYNFCIQKVFKIPCDLLDLQPAPASTIYAPLTPSLQRVVQSHHLNNRVNKTFGISQSKRLFSSFELGFLFFSFLFSYFIQIFGKFAYLCFLSKYRLSAAWGQQQSKSKVVDHLMALTSDITLTGRSNYSIRQAN